MSATAPQPVGEPRLLSASEVARRLGVGVRRLHDLLAAGQFPKATVLRGPRRYWSSDVVARYFADLTAARE